MKLKVFRQELKAAGGDYKEFISNVECWRGPHISVYILGMRTSADVLQYTVTWEFTPQGYEYWNAIHKRLIINSMVLSEEKSSLNYDIRSCGTDWIVGCQTIDRKTKLKIFKLLAEDLGYDID